MKKFRYRRTQYVSPVKQPLIFLLTPAIWYLFREVTKKVTSPTYAANISRPSSAGNTSHP